MLRDRRILIIISARANVINRIFASERYVDAMKEQ